MSDKMPNGSGLILCPVLEPGRSGVGDYAVQLAKALRELGHPSRLVALNDPGVTSATEEEQEGLPVLRLPTGETWQKRLAQTQAWTAKTPPAWVSVQLVLYGYHPKGLPAHLPRLLATLAGPVPVEVMVHETWLGDVAGARLKERVYGVMQRALFKRTLQALRPVVLHTHALPYEEQLRKLGFVAQQLPLFSNIPVTKTLVPDWLAGRLPGLRSMPREKRWHFGVFGSLYPEWNLPALLPVLRRQLQAAGKTGVVVSLGHIGEAGRKRWQEWTALGDETLQLHQLGALSENEVSQCLHDLDYGLSATPPDLIEKSAAAAALLAHGLPVIASREPVYGHALAEQVAARCPRLVWGKGVENLGSLHRIASDDGLLKRVAGQFLTGLSLSKRA